MESDDRTFSASRAHASVAPESHHALLRRLIAAHEIPITWASIFDTAPGPLPGSTSWDRVEGMLLGLAIGDALGKPTESWLPYERRARYGEIRDYPQRPDGNVGPGLPSDDTQLSFWTLEHLLDHGHLEPEQLAARFCRQRIFGIGKSMRKFIGTYKSGQQPWYHCGAPSAGNGALMRIAPMLVPYVSSDTPALWADVALSASMTHRDPASISACVAFVSMLWQLLQMQDLPSPTWWLDSYVAVAHTLEGHTSYRPRGGDFADFRGPLWQFVEDRVGEACRLGQPVLDACNSWFSGAYLLETVPSALYILMQYAHDPEEALVRAVNDTKDNDTVAAIVGAAVGALHGKRRLPARWITGLSGRTGEHDDGRVFELIDAAKRTWWHDEPGLER